MINGKYIGILSGLAFTLFLLGVNGSDFGISPFITSNRIAIFLLVLINIIIIFRNNHIHINKNILIISVTFVLISIWGFISILLSPFQGKTSVSPIITCILIAIVLMLISNIILSNNDHLHEYFLNTVILLGTCISVFYLTWGYLNVGNLTDNYMWRVTFSTTSNGLNRVLNGLLVIGMLNILVLFSLIKKKRIYTIFSLITLISLFILIIVTGSRQVLIGLIVTLLFTIILNLFLKKQLRKNIKRIIVILPVLSLVIFMFFKKNAHLSTWFIDRFINRTMEGSTGDSERTGVLREAFSYIESNPFFGVGPGVFPSINSYGLSTHNGYVYMLVSYGLIPTVTLIVIILISLLGGFKNLKRIADVNAYNTYLFSFFTVTVLFFVSNLLNDLMDEYFFWIMIVFLVSIPFHYKRHCLRGG